MGDENHISGDLPFPFRTVESSSPSSPDGGARLLSARFACFFSRAERVVSLRPSSSSSSDSDDSEPDKLSSRSVHCQQEPARDAATEVHLPPISFSNSGSDTGFPPRSFCLRL